MLLVEYGFKDESNDLAKNIILCNNLGKNTCKNIYNTMVMGHIFQAKWWEKHPSRCSFSLLWLRKLAKEMEKALERKMAFFGNLFMKIREIKRKRR